MLYNRPRDRSDKMYLIKEHTLVAKVSLPLLVPSYSREFFLCKTLDIATFPLEPTTPFS